MAKRHKKIGLALGSGGLKGFAHIGVLKVLEENHIPIDYIAGTSAGAIIGGLYAMNSSILLAEKLAQQLDYQDLIKVFFDPRLHLGLVGGDNATQFLEQYIGNTKIEDLKIPFRAIASDIQTGQIVIFDKGKLSTALRASSSVPFIFTPVHYRGHYLIDGGASQPVPAETVKKMGADIVIAVNLDDSYFAESSAKITMTGLLKNSINLLHYQLSKENVKNADIVINPEVPDISWLRIKRAKQLIKKGEEATRKVIPHLLKLLNS